MHSDTSVSLTWQVLLQVPAEMETPEWGGIFPAATSGEGISDGAKEEKGAAPKSWRGLGEWQVSTPSSIRLTPVGGC